MDNISCCIIAVQKDEPYIENWIDYHLNLGFSHIFIIDNNNKGNELYLPEKYKSRVSIFPANSIIDHHISRVQYKLYNFVLNYIRSINSIREQYTHVLTIDIDEYFYYSKSNNINDFIINELKNLDVISIPWICYNDNNIIYKKDLPSDNVIQNYPQIANVGWIHNDVKSLAKITDNTVLDVHFHNNNYHCPITNSLLAHIKHYRTQCLEEYIDKIIIRRCGDNKYWYNFNKNNIKVYFNYNDITNEKLDAFKYFYKKYNLKMSQEDQEFIERNYK